MTRRTPQSGPPLAVPAGVALALTVASALAFASGPRPDTSAAVTLDYLRLHDTRLSVLSFLVFATSIPLAVYSAAVYRRLRRLGVTAPGAAIALTGGTLASASIALSGLVTWVGTRSIGELTAPLAHVLVDLSFVTGGVGFAVPFGLLIAGLAVPVLALRLAPRVLGWLGLLLAALAMVTSLALLSDALFPLLPVVRFGGLLWLIAAGLLLPATRHDARAVAA